jgi:membrane protein
VIAIAGLMFSRQAAVGQIVWQIQTLVGHDGAEVIKAMLNGARKPASGIIATFLGLVTLFFGASSVIAELKDALDTIWEVPERRSDKGFKSLLTILRNRTLAFAMVLGIGFLLLVSLAINAAISAIGAYFEWYLPTHEWLLHAGDALISFLVIAFLFALLYKFLPDVFVAWGDVALGACITSLLFTLGKLLIGIYLGRASITSTYGAAGSLVVLLVWIYYSAQIVFVGAEFTHAYAELYGSQPSRHVGREVQITGG